MNELMKELNKAMNELRHTAEGTKAEIDLLDYIEEIKDRMYELDTQK